MTFLSTAADSFDDATITFFTLAFVDLLYHTGMKADDGSCAKR